jgi:uncharacterized Zn finger protein
MWGNYPKYVPVATRRRQAEAEATRQAKKGAPLQPIVVEGRAIARTFWGQAWCENLERYSDYANRLPRGRTYVRNGSVIHLEVGAGEVRAQVSGSSLYAVRVQVKALPRARWNALRADCTGGISSLVELLQGRLSAGVMERICRPKVGLFPAPAEIELDCSCPDWASMCKHVAAVLYGVGVRLDDDPGLLFRLRQVDEAELVAEAGLGLALNPTTLAKGRLLEGDGLGDLFGLDMAEDAAPVPARAPARAPARVSTKVAAAARGPKAAPAQPGSAAPPSPLSAARLGAITKVEQRLAQLRAAVDAGTEGKDDLFVIRQLEVWLANTKGGAG